MQFLFPAFLIASLAIAIPILIHLFHFRRFKQVYFTNVRFLREIKEETASRSRLRNLLVLALRILAILFLVAAFAQPFLPRGEEAAQGPKAVSIYLDNSFSMEALSRDVSLFEQARQKALALVEGYGPQDRFHILTNAYTAQEQRLFGKEAAMARIQEVGIGPEVTIGSTVLQRQKQVLATDPERETVQYLVSDFQTGTWSASPHLDSGAQVYALPIQAVSEQNLSIDTAWFAGPTLMTRQTNQLIIALKNNGRETVEQVRLAIRESGQEKPVGTLRVPAGATVYDTVAYTPQQAGWQGLEILITDYPVQFDDTYYLAAPVQDQLGVLVIQDPGKGSGLPVGLAGIRTLSTTTQNANRIDYEGLGRFQLIILDGLSQVSSGLSTALTSYIQEGGNVLLAPPPAPASLGGYTSFLNGVGARPLGAWQDAQMAVSQINTEAFVFRDVFVNQQANLRLPEVSGRYGLLRSEAVSEEPLLIFRDGSPLISRYPVEQGNLFLSVSPLSPASNDLARNGEIFVPMIYRMAISGLQATQLAYTLGRDDVAEVPVALAEEGDNLLRMRSRDIEVIPQQRFQGSKARLALREGLSQAGIYTLLDRSDRQVGLVGLNYDRRESDMTFVSGEELAGQGLEVIPDVVTAELSSWVGERERGVVLWRLCVLLALCSIVLETLILRFWRS